MKRILSGIQPTNQITLGNYLGAIKHLVKYQDEFESYIFVADLHAMSVNYDSSKLINNRKSLVCTLLASELDLKKTKIFYQSLIPAHSELYWILTTNTFMGELSRMTQFKDKSSNLIQANGTTSIPVGLFMYPVLMAADVLLYDVDYVVVGIDQKQHLELTNDIAIRMNKKYGNLFKISEPAIDKDTSKIMDLRNPLIKMSKSNVDTNGTIFLLDDIENVTKKIMSAKTDSLNKVKFDVANQPGISNLITIYASLTNTNLENVEKKFKNKDYGVFKKEVVSIVCEFLKKFQKKYNELINNFSNIEKNIIDNSNECSIIANNKLQLIKRKIGLI